MTVEELGRTLSDVIGELEGVSLGIDSTVGLLMEVDGKVIVQDETDNDIEADQPYMTIEALSALIGDALGELDSVITEIENARDLLQSIDGNALTTD